MSHDDIDTALAPSDAAADTAIDLVPDTSAPSPRRRRRTLLAAGAGVVAVLAVLGGLLVTRGGDDEPKSVLAAAASATQAKGTARMEMSMRLAPAGGNAATSPVSTKVTSEVDFDAKVSHMVLDLGSLGALSGTSGQSLSGSVDMVTSGLVAYMKGSGLGDVFAGKWLKIDYGVLLGAQGLDIASLTRQQGNDPAKMLDLLRQAGDIVIVGPDTVRGAATTHYRATIEPKALYASSGAVADQAKVDALVAKFTGPIVTDVWLGTDRLVRRYSMTMTTTDASMAYDYEMYDFGVKVDVKIPADKDVIDVTKMLGR